MRIFHDPRSFKHETGPGHPERVPRLSTVMETIDRLGLEWDPPADSGWPDGTRLVEAITAIHDTAYVARLEKACQEGRPFIDAADSAICPASFGAALGSAACALAATEVVCTGETTCSYAITRPPGHHCERDHSMGFCLFNNVAVAAEWALTIGGLRRAAIVDFDVHHGNGTQHLFEERDDVIYISIHQHPDTQYPGTGHAWERGRPGTPGAGATLNLPLLPGTGDRELREVWQARGQPTLEAYAPEIIFISAGFDADARDPLGGLNWSTSTFTFLTRSIVDTSNRTAAGRVVSVLEGGYDLTALAQGVEAMLLEMGA